VHVSDKSETPRQASSRTTLECNTSNELQDIASPPPLWVLRQKGPLPMRFDYAQDVEHGGIKAKR
jgi:hypothetical protein